MVVLGGGVGAKVYGNLAVCMDKLVVCRIGNSRD